VSIFFRSSNMPQLSLRLILSGFGTSKHSGCIISMAFDSDMTVAQAKESIVMHWPHDLCDVGIQKKKINLLLAGQLLQNDQPLQNYFHQADFVPAVHLMLQPLVAKDDEEATARPEQVEPSSKCCLVM
jgi:hypothetical protein